MDIAARKQRYLANPDDAITVVHIPARGGSTRVPRKNIRLLGDEPLIAYSICLARSLRGVDRIIVNTDSDEIATVAKEYGAEAPFLRPADISHETALLQDAQRYAMDWLESHGATLASFVTIYPTNPFRNLGRAQAMLDEVRRRTLVGTMVRVPFCWDRLCMEREDGSLVPADAEAVGLNAPATAPILANTYRRFLHQRYPGNEHLASGELGGIKRTGHFIGIGFHDNNAPEGDACYFEIEDPLERIDIDTDEDFALAEEMLHGFDFGYTVARPKEKRG